MKLNKNNYKELPLVYSCSGCSNIAQMANDIAVKLDREGVAEMSCVAGVGGKVKSLVKKAQSGKPIIVIDGCPLECAKNCLKNVGVEPDVSLVLTEEGLKKTFHEDYDERTIEDEYQEVKNIVEMNFNWVCKV
ncbi:MAG: zinc-binding protein [Ignavibacteriae bacterium]|nr:zinc-binding protein [Ignavibacteriota bacterium]